MIITIWLFAGIIADILCAYFIARSENKYWDSWCNSRNLDRRFAPNHTAKEMLKESPWGSHLIIIIFPPSAFTRIAMINQ